MGVVVNIAADSFPRQYEHVGMGCEVLFHFDTTRRFRGTVLRDDAEAPWETILQLEDGRVVTAGECQWRPLRLGE